MARIGVKYCGGCNPRIDRSKLVREIVRMMPPESRLVAESPLNPWDAGILVCGCPVACADRPEVRRMARRWIRVGGETVDLESVPEDGMARVIAGKLKTLE